MPSCKLTGKRPKRGNHVSHSNNKTKRWLFPNVQKKRIWLPEEGRWVRVRLSTRALRSLNRMGLSAYAKKQGISVKELLS